MDNELFSKWLNEWPHTSPGNVRKVVDPEGRDKILVRVDQGAFQGILQMYVDGRPDGTRPFDEVYYLDYFKRKLREHKDFHQTEKAFYLLSEECEKLFDESLRIYQRYVFLLQLEDYERVIRDTERNMQVFRFVNKYARKRSDRQNLEKWWPYILRINAVARAMLHLQDRKFDQALGAIDNALAKIESLKPVEAEEFEFEMKRSLEILNELKDQIQEQRPLGLEDKLNRELELAVQNEDYERAAQLRDRLQALTDSV